MPPNSVRVATAVFAYRGGEAAPGALSVPAEVPVEVSYGGVPFAVMMATPDDLEDFALGFSFTEGVVARPDEVRGVAVEAIEGGIRLAVALSPDRLSGHLARRRALSGRTGCGLCGVGDLAALAAAGERRVAPAPDVPVVAIERALAGLEERQHLNARTRAVHAAAWADPAGEILALREDVGRHNALDKLVGALLRAGIGPRDGFALITSRCSFEMVDKAAAFGAGMLVAVSAPTSLALDTARALGMTLMGIARRDSVTVFSGPDRTAERGAAA